MKHAKGDALTLLMVVPIIVLAKTPNVMMVVVHPASGIHTAWEPVAQAKARPNTLSYASAGVGSGLQLAGELFKQRTGADIPHVPYKGSATALTDVPGVAVPILFRNLLTTIPFIKNGNWWCWVSPSSSAARPHRTFRLWPGRTLLASPRPRGMACSPHLAQEAGHYGATRFGVQ